MAENLTISALPTVPCRAYAEARSEIRSGDILMCSGAAPFSRLIQGATKSPWSHVGWIVYSKPVDRMILLESVESIGVRAVSLRSYIANYNGTGQPYGGRMFIARHANVHVDQLDVMRVFFQSGLDLLGHPYDRDQIVRIAARIASYASGRQYNEIRPDNEFICSEYVQHCFRQIGIEIPCNTLGFCAPADFATCPEIEILWEIESGQTAPPMP